MIVQKGDQQAGLVVDNLIGQQEIVIKSLGKYINGNKLISGATILGDGDVLILDVNINGGGEVHARKMNLIYRKETKQYISVKIGEEKIRN